MALATCDKPSGESKLTLDPFGTVRLFKAGTSQRNVILYFSGAKGWTDDLTSRARGVAWPDRVVVGIDLPTYLKNLKPKTKTDGSQCLDFTAGLPDLLQAVSKAEKAPVDPAPFFVAADEGGSVAYAAATQSQPKSVEGLVAETFCPVLRTPLPPCDGPGGIEATPAPDGNGFLMTAAKSMTTPFVAIADAEACKATDLDAFVEAMPDARVVEPIEDKAIDLLISVVTQTGANVASIPAVSAAELADLPLVEVPGAPGQDDRLAIILTGDGGWADIDKEIGETLAARGVGVIGFSTLKYFWKEQTPEQTATDLERVVRYYMHAWNRKRLVLIGYSFGASVLPFVTPRLPDDMRQQITLTALLAPGPHATFEISVGGWIGNDDDDGPEVGSAIAALDTRKILCVHGDEEDDTPCPAKSVGRVETFVLKGGHHFDGAYKTIAEKILKTSEAVAAKP